MTLDERLLKVFHDIFDDTVELRDDTTADDIEDWDSLHHINLMYLIEEEFGVQFVGNQLAEMADIGELKAFLADHSRRT
ncbi:MAG TPA: acyl carrier protein [Acidimicrobiales bacterium]|nr:acyl carrier protein [Acidimicrobiales bacterium]